jgi:hypothetical protein
MVLSEIKAHLDPLATRGRSLAAVDGTPQGKRVQIPVDAW